MKSPAEIIATKCSQTEGLELLMGSNCFIGNEPEASDFCATFYDVGGGMQSPKFYDEFVEVQARVRAIDYSQGWELIKKISLFLNGITPFNFEDERIEGIWLLTPPYNIGRDKTDHPIFTATFRILINPSQTGNLQQY